MKKAKLFYNPGAGTSSYQPGDLMSILESNGYESSSVSVKEKGWDTVEDDIDFVIVAGGDGTVKKVCTFLINARKADLPIGLIPLGTANNIASSLKVGGSPADIIKAWREENIQKYDVGRARFADNTYFFFESFGFGFFPYFFQKAGKDKLPEPETPEQSLFHALKKMEHLLPGFELFQSKTVADEKEFSGNYFLLELMLIQHIGPGISLAPKSELNDGFFDMVILSSKNKDKLATYVSDKLNEKESEIEFSSNKVKKILVQAKTNLIHIDDEVIEVMPSTEMKIKILPEALKFFKL